LLTDPSLILEPDLDRPALGTFRYRLPHQLGDAWEFLQPCTL
jgi:hypothetical protein